MNKGFELTRSKNKYRLLWYLSIFVFLLCSFLASCYNTITFSYFSVLLFAVGIIFYLLYESKSKNRLFIIIELVIVTVISVGLFIAIINFTPIAKVASKQRVSNKSEEVSRSTLPVPTISPTIKPIATKQDSPVPILSNANIFTLINNYRSINGLPTFQISKELCPIAEKRASYLISNDVDTFRNVIGANLSNHPGFTEALNEARNNGTYTGQKVSENLFKDAINDKMAVDGWKNSASHNSLLLITERDGILMNQACVTSRARVYGSIVVLLVGDR